MIAAFRRIFYAALCAGLISGFFAALAHQFGTVPLILKAESYEKRAAVHDRGAIAAWAPEDRVERAVYTAVADLLGATGFALLLAAGIALHGGEGGWREGLFWGLAGFAIFTLAPSLGLPPEIPGSIAAPLFERQLWWLSTAASTAAALAIFAFTKRPSYAAVAAILIVLPHLYGAPQPAEHASGSAPEALAHRFVELVSVLSFLFWALLGSSTGYFFRLFKPRSG